MTWNGEIAPPTVESAVNVVDGVQSYTWPPVSMKRKTISSPLLSAYIMMLNMFCPTNGPNGTTDTSLCTPRTSEPANAPSVPADGFAPLTVASTVAVIEFWKSPGLTDHSPPAGDGEADGPCKV